MWDQFVSTTCMPHASITTEQRRRWMSILARAEPAALEAACASLDELPPYMWLRPPETGLVMIRGRIGGTGSKFNLGEMTMTRCVLRLPSGAIGHAYVQGANARHAELAAVTDALMQVEAWHAQVRDQVVERLAAMERERCVAAAREAEATRVDFYTLARGEDAR